MWDTPPEIVPSQTALLRTTQLLPNDFNGTLLVNGDECFRRRDGLLNGNLFQPNT